MRAWVATLVAHAGALLGVLAALVALALLSRFVTDDAAITLRYSVQLAAGHGLRWNPGEHPVEGYSNFSHVLLGAAAIKLGLPPLSSLRVFNQLCMLGVSALTYALAWHALRNRVFATAGAVLVGAHPALAYWASSGLETASYLAASYAGILASLHPRIGRSVWPALPLLFAAFTRLEGVVVFGCVVAALCLQALLTRDARSLRAFARAGSCFVLAYLAYFAWRVSYFGHLLSNSAYFKLRDPNGLRLIAQFVAQNGALLALAVFAPWARLGRLGTTIALLTLVYGVGFYGVKDSVADFHRFFLPLVPGIAILAVAVLARIHATVRLGRLRHALAGASFLLVLAFDALHPVSGFANLRSEVALLDTRIVSRANVARTLAAQIPPELPVAVDDVGVIGFVLENPIEDLFGLNSERFIHHFQRERRGYVRELIAARPAAVVAVSRDPHRFRAAYATGWVITSAPNWRRDYRELAVMASPAEDYHYFVFVRRDLATPNPLRMLALRSDLSLARAVDELHAQVRQRP